jgi:transposase
MQAEVTMERIIYIGIDVHKDTNTAHMFGRIGDVVLDYEIGTIAAGADHLIKAIRKTIKEFNLGDCAVQAGYEAGPTGYGLCKALQKAGYMCDVMAPTTIKRAPGERTKTDRRDARMLAIALATDTYKSVHVLDDKDISTRRVHKNQEHQEE